MNKKEYQEKIRNAVAGGLESLLLAAGAKLKLFDYLGNETQPRSSHEIANLGSFKERYVREWLGAMVAAKFVECDPTGTTFWMSSQAKNALTSEESQHELLHVNLIPFLSLVFAKICNCFELDGPSGVSYSDCGPVHELIGSVLDVMWETYLISHFIPTIPGLEEQLERGITCLDVGCGHGTLVLLLASRFPASQFYGVDISEKAVQMASNRALEKSISNAHFVTSNAAQLPSDWSSKFTYATMTSAIHDFARPDICLQEIIRVLKPGGRLSVVEVSASSNIYKNKDGKDMVAYYTCSLFQCMPLSLYFPESFGLGLVPGAEQMTAILNSAEFDDVTIIDMPWNKMDLHFLCTKSG